MESLSVTILRNLARDTVFASGARGFMRFAAEGDVLLLTDAALRCEDGGIALAKALETAGFVCEPAGALLGIIPGDALIARLCAREGGVAIDWESPLHPAQALAARLMRSDSVEIPDMTARGRAFVLRTARMLWQPESRVLAQLSLLRAEAAALLREGDRSGLAPAGRLLANWTEERSERTKEDLLR